MSFAFPKVVNWLFYWCCNVFVCLHIAEGDGCGKAISLAAPRELRVHPALPRRCCPGAPGPLQLPPGSPVTAEQLLRAKADGQERSSPVWLLVRGARQRRVCPRWGLACPAAARAAGTLLVGWWLRVRGGVGI